MKNVKLLITVGVFLMTCLVGGIALANDPPVFGPEASDTDSSLTAPNLTVTITGINKMTLNWNQVDGADSYQVHYAQYPYDNPDTIYIIDVGKKTSASYNIMEGSAYHVAVKACDASGLNCSDYSQVQTVIIPLGSSFINTLGQEFKLIPAATFTMGSPATELGRGGDETQHPVILTRNFYMQTTEVTTVQWNKVMGTNLPGSSTSGTDDPVVFVFWNDAQDFIKKLNELEGTDAYRLPTEAEWEYAYRAGSTTAYYNGHISNPDGDDPNLDKIGWYGVNSNASIHPVAQKMANSWGLYDMSGNVSEWVQDWYGAYPSSAVTDPTGPSSGTVHVVRGGNWGDAASFCRSAKRYGVSDSCSWSIGFRLARDE